MRTSVFLDLENLLLPYLRADRLHQGVGLLLSRLRALRQEGPLVGVVGVCDERLRRRIAVELFSEGCIVFGHDGGADGADLALIERIKERTPPSVDRVVIGSGDRIFMDALWHLRALGKSVEVLALLNGVATSLRLAADRVLFLPAPSMRGRAA